MVEDGLSGLLFPNNDEDALLERLRSIASRDAFPDHTLPAEVLSRVADRFGGERHVALVRRILSETVAHAS